MYGGVCHASPPINGVWKWTKTKGWCRTMRCHYFLRLLLDDPHPATHNSTKGTYHLHGPIAGCGLWVYSSFIEPNATHQYKRLWE